MSRNAALISKLQIEADAVFVSGLTASVPVYQAMDPLGNKQWVVNVYIGPPNSASPNLLYNVPIVSYALALLSTINQPVTLQRTRQGTYTVIGLGDAIPSGAQMDNQSILTPTFHDIQYNLAELGLMFIADLDWQREGWGVKKWADPGTVWQQITASDAFGYQVLGPDQGEPPEITNPTPMSTVTTKHLQVSRYGWGAGGPGAALVWGVTPWGAPFNQVLTHTE